MQWSKRRRTMKYKLIYGIGTLEDMSKKEKRKQICFHTKTAKSVKSLHTKVLIWLENDMKKVEVMITVNNTYNQLRLV